jgi:glutaredoxin-like protein NrdH
MIRIKNYSIPEGEIMAVEHVPGRNIGQVKLFALSTCAWCKKTRRLLEESGIAYDYEYVDLLQGNERDETMRILQRWNPNNSFPTLVINNKCIVGFKENEIREALNR